MIPGAGERGYRQQVRWMHRERIQALHVHPTVSASPFCCIHVSILLPRATASSRLVFC